MTKRINLTKNQRKILASFFKTIAEGAFLGSSTAYLLPEAIQLKHPIALSRYFLFVIASLISLLFSAILDP